MAWAGELWCSEDEAAWHERSRRYQAALAEVRAAQPAACPLCGGGVIPLSFEAEDRRWQCEARDCLTIVDAREVAP